MGMERRVPSALALVGDLHPQRLSGTHTQVEIGKRYAPLTLNS